MKDVWLVYGMSEDGTMYVLSEHESKEDAQKEASKLNSKPLAMSSFGFVSTKEMVSNFSKSFRTNY